MLARVAERRMAEVVRQDDRLDQVLVRAERARDGARDLSRPRACGSAGSGSDPLPSTGRPASCTAGGGTRARAGRGRGRAGRRCDRRARARARCGRASRARAGRRGRVIRPRASRAPRGSAPTYCSRVFSWTRRSRRSRSDGASRSGAASGSPPRAGGGAATAGVFSRTIRSTARVAELARGPLSDAHQLPGGAHAQGQRARVRSPARVDHHEGCRGEHDQKEQTKHVRPRLARSLGHPYPGGQRNVRPPNRWRCRWNTV